MSNFSVGSEKFGFFSKPVKLQARVVNYSLVITFFMFLIYSLSGLFQASIIEPVLDVNKKFVSPSQLNILPQTITATVESSVPVQLNRIPPEYLIMPDGLSESSWFAINAASKVKLVFSEHQLQLRPLINTERWRLGFKLTAVNNLGQLTFSSDPNIKVDKNRITFKHENFNEWYINSPTGIEHGYTILSRQNTESNRVSFTIALSGNINVEQRANDLLFYSAAGVLVSQYSHLTVIDATGKKLNATLHYDNMLIRIDVNTSNAVFPITVDPVVTIPRSLVGPAQDYAEMGIDVDGVGDVNGDGIDDVVVGIHGYNNRVGGIQVYFGSENGLVLPPLNESWLISPTIVGAGFGTSVSGAGDIDGDGFADVIVGAWQYSVTPAGVNQALGSREGAFYVYYGSSAGLIREQQIIGVQAGAMLGFAVGRAGSVNGDKYADIIVSAPRYSGQNAFAGRVYVYFGSASGIQADPWYTEIAQDNMFLGSSVNTVGDVNGDFTDDFIMGAIYYDHSRTATGNVSVDSGGAFLHFGSLNMTAGLATTSPIEFTIDNANANFGVSVDGAADINRDGFLDIVVGANNYTDTGAAVSSPKSGAITAFFGPFSKNATPISQLYIGTQSNENFGYSVSGLGDVNGDGYADVSVGAFQHDYIYINDGAVFVLYGGKDGLNSNTPNDVVYSDPVQAESRFGISAKAAGDTNGDGYQDLLVGANLLTRTNINQGQAFLFEGRGNSDLSITVTDNVDIVSPGTEVIYAISVVNKGPDPAKRLVVINTLPLGSEFVSVTSGNFLCDAAPNGSNLLYCRLNSVAPLATSDIFVNLILNTNDSTFATQVSANVVDQFTANNQSSDLTLVTVNPPINTAPVAKNSILDIVEDSGQTTANLIATDADRNTLTYSISVQPTMGFLSIVSSTGKYFYTPTENKNGTDSFKFKVFDGTLYSQLGLVTVNIAPVQDNPVAYVDSYSINEDTKSNRLLNFIDPDPLDTLSFQINTAPAMGSIVFTDTATGAYEYTPNKNYFGNDFFTFSVFDGTVMSNEARIDITIESINDVPTVDNQIVYVTTGVPLTTFLVANDVEKSPLKYEILTNPSKGVVSLNTDTGEFTYNANNDADGPDFFTFFAFDGESKSEFGKVSILLNVSTPLAAAQLSYPGDGVAIVGSPVTLQWYPVISEDNVPVSYQVLYCDNLNFTDCDPIQISYREPSPLSLPQILALGGTGTGVLFLGLLTNLNRRRLKFVIGFLFLCYTVVSCSKAADQASKSETPVGNIISYSINTLSISGTYYWKVLSIDGGGRLSTSETWRFDWNS